VADPNYEAQHTSKRRNRFFTDIAKTLSKDFGYNNSLNSSESETELVEDEKVG
jgi:hypothetical protein